MPVRNMGLPYDCTSIFPRENETAKSVYIKTINIIAFITLVLLVDYYYERDNYKYTLLFIIGKALYPLFCLLCSNNSMDKAYYSINIFILIFKMVAGML